MRTSKQCTDKAIELEALADVCTDADAYEYKQIAAEWRALAKQAAWQDVFQIQSIPRRTH
jgi:hypothetical protein